MFGKASWSLRSRESEFQLLILFFEIFLFLFPFLVFRPVETKVKTLLFDLSAVTVKKEWAQKSI